MNIIRGIKYIILNCKVYYIVFTDYNKDIKCFTFTKNVERIKPVVIEDVNDFNHFYKNSQFNFFERFILLFKALLKGVDIKWYVQYENLKKQIKKLDKQKNDFKKSFLIMEECMDIERQIFLDIMKNLFKKVIITYRGVIMTPVKFPHNVLIKVSNFLTFNLISLYNEEINFMNKFISTIAYNYSRTTREKIRIGYIAEIGDFYFNYKDKILMDELVCSLSDIYSIYISIHPQERNRNIVYYQNLCNKYLDCNIRYDNDIEEFFDEIDIVIGCISTVILQAFFYRKPVILIDFFNDKYYINYLNDINTCGMVQIAKNKDEIKNKIDFFYNMDELEINKRYDIAFNRFLIKDYNKKGSIQLQKYL